MIDGLNTDGDTPHLRIVFLSAEKSVRRVFDSDTKSAMVGPIAWMSGSKLFVVGSACPAWSREAGSDSSDGSDLDKICGTSRQELLSLDLDSGKWVTLVSSLDQSQFPLYGGSGDADFALLGAGLSTRLNVDGTTRTLNTSRLPSDASFFPCITSGGAIAISHSTGPDNASLGAFILHGDNWEPISVSDDKILSFATIGCTADGLFLSGVTG